MQCSNALPLRSRGASRRDLREKTTMTDPDLKLQQKRGLKTSRIPIKVVQSEPLRKPEWIRVRAGGGERFTEIKKILREANLHTVCEEASCPNIGECFGHGTATFMIMGDLCTRRCPFCDVAHGRPQPLDREEPRHHIPDGRRRSILRSITDLGSEPFPEGRDSVDQSLRVSVRTLLPLARILAARPLSAEGICDASVSFVDADAPTGSDRKITTGGSNSGGTLGGVTSGSQDAGRLDCREYDEADDSGRSRGAT
jgi:hypothetical protein